MAAGAGRTPTALLLFIASAVPDVTAGYAYNRHVADTKMVLWATSQTFLFSEVTQLQKNGTLQEPFGGYFGSPYLAVPPGPFVTPGTTYAITPAAVTAAQFRFAGLANVAFLDGHVETRMPVDAPMPAGTFPQATWDDAKVKYNLGFLSGDNFPYAGS